MRDSPNFIHFTDRGVVGIVDAWVLAAFQSNRHSFAVCVCNRRLPVRRRLHIHSRQQSSVTTPQPASYQLQITAMTSSSRKASFAKYLRSLVPRHGAVRPKNCSAASSSSSLTSHPSSSSLDMPVLTDTAAILDNPFRLWQLRHCQAPTATIVGNRLNRVTSLDVRRVPFGERLDLSPDVETVTFAGTVYYVHPSGHVRLLARFIDDSNVELLVEEQWSSKDVLALQEIISMFRYSVEELTLDAPVIELIIASLSMIDLDRWYAFLCFMKAVNNHDMHLAIERSHSTSSSPTNTGELYFPQCREIVIRTTEADSNHLARIIDYGVRSKLVVDRTKLESLKVIITDVRGDQEKRELNRNLYHFRCWCGSAGFDDRYRQQFVLEGL
uniref:Tudor domain-containing protein n=1 Tax=Panagrellus redivivus TaxID=6233 RepID=A0A7E4UQI3_PANRE